MANAQMRGFRRVRIDRSMPEPFPRDPTMKPQTSRFV
jgi:hypothetical protein